MIILASLLLIASFAFGQDVLRQHTTDQGGLNFYGIISPDGVTPCPDGWLIHVIVDGGNGTIDGADAVTHLPIGDDNLCLNNNFYELAVNTGAWGFPGGMYWIDNFIFEDPLGSPPEPVANCGDWVFLRVYNANDLASATQYCNVSAMQVGPPPGTGPGTMDWPYWDDDNWIPFGAPAGPYIYLEVHYSDDSECIFPDELDDVIVINQSAKADTLFWGDPAIDAYGDTIEIDIGGFAGDGDIIDITVTATSPDPGIGQESNTYSDTVSGTGNQDWTYGAGGGLTLPVELASFTAVTANKLVVLQWTTQSETDNMGFNVFRATTDDLNSAEKVNLSMILGQGTTSEQQTYEFEDDMVENGLTYYYWLEQVDYDGESVFHGPIEATPQEPGIPELEYCDETLLEQNCPNPFNPTTLISYKVRGEIGVDEEYVELKIYNVLGELVETLVSEPQKAGPHKVSWTCPTDASGIYFYQLKTDSFVETKKMVILK